MSISSMKNEMSCFHICLLVFCDLICTVDAGIYTFDDTGGLGRQFDGIGGLSGGGATSKLLVNYPEEQRNQILDYLFKPNFGASLHILKVEIGGDVESSDGTEASHMRNSWEENYERGYEWWLMVEAKKRNPNIKLYGLPWGFPGWIGAGTRSPYTNPTQTATYIIKWIEGAKTYYNLTIDYIGIWNEKYYDGTYILTLRRMLNESGFNHVSIVAADSGWYVADDLLNNSSLAAAVEYIGCHYPETFSDEAALKTGKQLWSSEDFSRFNDVIGGSCWGRTLNQNYVNGYITSTISWTLIYSYYHHIFADGHGLMTAIEPWSGNYVVESPIWMTAHTTQFTEIGWKYLRHGAGVGKLDDGGSHVALVSPDNKDLTIIIETFSHDHSACSGQSPKYKVLDQQVTIILQGNLVNITELQVWHSKPSYDSNQSSIFFNNETPLQLVNGQATLTVRVDEIYTLTTLKTGSKGDYPEPPSSQPFPQPYSDDFESYTPHQEPYNIVPQVGSYEVLKSNNKNHSQILRQTVLEAPLNWCPITLDFPLAITGDFSWSDIYVEVDTCIGNINNTDGVFIAARIINLSCTTFEADGVYFFIFPSSNKIQLSKDLALTQVIFTGNYSNFKEWNTLSLALQGNLVTAMINGENVLSYNITGIVQNGFVGFGNSKFGLADFDNLKVMTLSDGLKRMTELSHSSQRNLNRNLYFKPKY